MEPHVKTREKKVLKSFKDMSIRNKFSTVFIFFTLLSVILYLSVTYYQNIQSGDAAVIDASGRQRMISQRIAFLSEMVVAHGKEKFKTDLKQAIELCNTSLDTLKLGGIAPGTSNNRALPSTPISVMPALIIAEDLWQRYKVHALTIVESPVYVDILMMSPTDTLESASQPMKQKVKNPKVLASLSFIEANAGEMLAKFNDLTNHYVEESTQKQNGLKNLLLVLLVTNIALVFIAIYLTRIYVRKPVEMIHHATQALVQGEINHQVPYESEDEIGRIIRNLNHLTQTLRSASEFAEGIGRGQFQSEFKAVSQKDKLGQSLTEMRDRLMKVADEDKKRNWATEGLAKFGEILRNDQEDIHSLANNIISHLVKYMKANQGALFIVNDDNDEEPFLELSAVYAWGKKKFINKKIAPGEGLAGQVWLEKLTLHIKEVPKNYVQITSGLGEANPRSILVVPLKLNEGVYGIIEMASFNIFEPYQIEFAEKLAESIASTISTARVNSKTKQLLEVTQQQAEQMSAQEEEMRQNMEELSATQEEMHRKNKEIERMLETSNQDAITQQNKFRHTLLNILDQLPHKIFLKDKDGKMVLVNTAVAKAHKIRAEELIGKSDFDFVDAETATKWRNQELEIIRKGSETYIFNENLAGETRTLKSTKMAFRIPHLEQVGLLGIQTDITELQQLKEMVARNPETHDFTLTAKAKT